jgi:hypothetical protein
MDEKLTRELLDEILSAIEGLEAQNLAVLQFLKDQKKGADKLAPYLEQGGKTSSVKWMATRARLNHLLDAATREAERVAEKSGETQAKSAEPATKVEKNSESKSERKDAKSEESPAEKREKVENSENTSEPEIPESASRTGEISSSDKPNTAESTMEKQADMKPSSEKQADHMTKSAA